MDCSYSMQEGIDVAKRCLKAAIKNLLPNTKFNILCFGTNSHFAFMESLSHSESHVTKAYKFIDTMNADMGDTAVMSAIRKLEAIDTTPSHPRVVIFITDGSVSNVEDCGAAARRATNVEQWHGIGVGSEASTALLREVTQQSEGTYRMVARSDPDETILDVIMSIILISTVDVAEADIRLESASFEDSLVLLKSPRLIRNNVPFDVIVVAHTRDPKITVKLITDNTKSFTLVVDQDQEQDVTELDVPEKLASQHILSAYYPLQQMEENSSRQLLQVHAAGTSLLGGCSPKILCELSKKSNVLCSGTSFLLTHRRPDHSLPETKGIGDRVSSCWVPTTPQGVFRAPKMSRVVTDGVSYASNLCERDGSGTAPPPPLPPSSFVKTSSRQSRSPPEIQMETKETLNAKSTSMLLVTSISSEGCWTKMSMPLCLVKYVPPPTDYLLKFPDPIRVCDVWCTLLVLNYLFDDIKSTPLSIQLIYKKASMFVESNTYHSQTVDSLIREYRTFMV